MTIAVAVRTGSAVVFAADSKLTTVGIAGYNPDGSAIWVDQTYDYATKVVHDQSQGVMCMVAGHANVGLIGAMDFIARRRFPIWLDKPDAGAAQDKYIAELVEELIQIKRAYWSTTKQPEDKWPGPILLLAATAPDRLTPRVWRIDLDGPGADTSEILQNAGLRLEGAYNEVFSLLYGYHFEVGFGAAQQLKIKPEDMNDAFINSKRLSPLQKINLWTMPAQDAMDLAYFLATVQIEMDRFLPGTPACGGPIDLMVLEMAPQPHIRTYPGKTRHHPAERGVR
jgi:hypothetical protein